MGEDASLQPPDSLSAAVESRPSQAADGTRAVKNIEAGSKSPLLIVYKASMRGQQTKLQP